MNRQSIVVCATLLALTGGVFSLPTVAAPRPTISPTTEDAAGYQLVMYKSSVLGYDRTYGISLPPGYNEHPDQRYPVIFLLHGGHGTPNDWFEKGKALSTIQALYDEGKLPPSIIITPDGYDQRGTSRYYDPAYVDGSDGEMDTAIGDELVRVVQSRYRTLPAPQYWAIGGLSSGGWGALNIGLHHADRFSVLFSHSGYFRDRSGSYNSPMLYVNAIPTPIKHQLRVYLDAGRRDGRFLSSTEQFHDVLTEQGVLNVFNTFEGGHGNGGADTGWQYWRKHLADSLTFVGAQFRATQFMEVARRSSPATPPSANAVSRTQLNRVGNAKAVMPLIEQR